jgi:hypothetical protein
MLGATARRSTWPAARADWWVGVDSAWRLAEQVGMSVTGIHPVGKRVVATLVPT